MATSVFDKIPQDVMDVAFQSSAQFMIQLMQGYNTVLTAKERANVAAEFVDILEKTYGFRLSQRGKELMLTQVSARLISLGY